MKIKRSLLPLLPLLSLSLFSCQPERSRFDPAESPAPLPGSETSFEDYLATTSDYIATQLSERVFATDPAPFGEGYSLETVVQMRSPFQINPTPDACTDSGAGAGMGFLMVHGLSDSPYLLKSVADSLSERYPCALIRGLLTPGHGTVPGDLLSVDRDDWLALLDWAVNGFSGQVNSLYLVGYSNGGTLAVNYLHQQPRRTALIQGLILLSPGLKTHSEMAWLTPWMRYLRSWVNQSDDTDAVKYESFPMHAAAEFYLLTRPLFDEDFRISDMPVFMAVSADDTTVQSQFAAEFFCTRIDSEKRTMLWLHSSITDVRPQTNCPEIEMLAVPEQFESVVSYSHVGLTLPPDDRHYGTEGAYPVCTAYQQTPDDYRGCRDGTEGIVYGENTIRDESGRYDGKLVRRTSFNPAYRQMIDRIGCFIDENCPR
ncbi:MAG: alpha/beta hydrolase [Pseudohongiellaceae bacterium]